MLLIRKWRYVAGWLKFSLFRKGISHSALVNLNCVISKKARIYMKSRLNGVELGDYSYIGKECIIHGTVIGKFCSISDRCVIGLPGHPTYLISTSPIFSSPSNALREKWVSERVFKPGVHVEIGNDVWIGYGALIPNNIRIGDGAVIAAGAVVTKDVPPYAIVGGVPARVIRFRFDEETRSCLESMKWWERSYEEIRRNISLFTESEVSPAKLKKWQS